MLNGCISELALYRRFVDDILIFTVSTNVANILNLVSSADSDLSTSYAEEDDGCCSFLEIKLIRLLFIIKFSIHRKATQSGQYSQVVRQVHTHAA